MMNKFHGVSELIAFLMVVLGIGLGPMVERPHAYVLSSEQLLQFMAAHFSKFETLVLTHSVERESQEGVKDFEEILTMKSPDLLHAETKDPSVNQGRVVDRSYRRLFLASTQSKVSALLSGAGVNTEKVSFTRVDGTIAYLIGDARPDSPKLAVEKARFLPLLFVYPSRLAGSTDLVKVTFRDYRQVEQGWYPFEILCSSTHGWAERYRIESIKVNVPVQPSLFLQAQEEVRPAESPAKEEKINAIIKTFEEKYGH
jgi:hypothetical protein